MMKRLADISYTVLECYLQGNWAQHASWIHIMLTFTGNLQTELNVGGSGWS